jgi:hypothetical protein
VPHVLTRFVPKSFKTISEVHPVWFLSIYLVFIPAFAWIYSFIPNGFYAPYARHEMTSKQDALRAAQVVQEALNHRITSTGGKPHQSFVPLYLIDPPHLSVIRTDDNGTLHFIVDLVFRDRDTPINANVNTFSIEASMVSAGRWNNHREGENKRSYRYIKFDKDQLAEFAKMFHNVPDFGIKLDSELSGFEVTEDEDQALQHFFDGLEGDPSKVSGTFPRMLYFSAMSITTVGFGDIVPLTSLSRFLVAFEAVTGVLLFGLFINAVTSRASAKHDDS